LKIFNYRFVIFVITLVFGVAFSMPSFLQTNAGKKIALGLDLQGGLHMLLGVQVDDAITTKIKALATSIKYLTNKDDILVQNLLISKTKLTFQLLDKDDTKNIDKTLKTIKGLNIVKTQDLKYTITLTPSEVLETKKMAVSQAVETIRNRLDQFGLSEPSVAKQGKYDIVVELPGIKNQAEEERAKDLIAKPAVLDLMAVDEARASDVYTMTKDTAHEYGDLILPSSNSTQTKYLVKEIPILNGSQVVDAKVAFDKSNQPIINFTLNSSGAKIFGDFTAKNIGKRLAVVLDGKVYSAPNIRERIGGGSGQISGGFTMSEAGNVAIALRSGALPAGIKILEKRSVGPSLGADSIKASLYALASGFILVVLFMLLYYRYAGLIANIALIANLFIILAIMALFGATLTLPGMAGIVLTIGMAVDANVIINERIRELLWNGCSLNKAIDDGYKNAMRAILDSNITTLLTSVILYMYGTGPIKGFAITLSIGIIVSMITAILGTHGIYEMLMPKISKSKKYNALFGVKI